MAQRTSAILTAVAILAGTSLLLWPTGAAAQAGPLGATFPVGINGDVRWPDVAYDPSNRVYLAVSGKGAYTRGGYLSDDGVPIGSVFPVHDPAPYAQAPRVTYSSDAGGFLVTWHQSTSAGPTAVFGRLIRFNGPSEPTYQISTYTAFWEMGAAVAYSSVSKEFLVAWQDANLRKVFARRLDGRGVPIGTQFAVPAPFFQRDPAIGYNPVSDEFIVGFGGYDDVAAQVGFQRVKAGTEAPIGGTTLLGSPSLATYIPEVACTPSGQCLIIWYQRSRSGAVFYGRVVNADGTMTTGAPIPIRTDFADYSALGVAHNAISNAYFMVTHSPTSYEDSGLEISPDGLPSAPFAVTSTGNRAGNFNPRVAAHATRAEWLMVTSFNFASTLGQRLGTASRYPGGGPIGPPPLPPPPVTIDLSPAAAPNGSWFLAEGVASNVGGGFDTYYLMANPDQTTPVDVTLYFSRDDGTTVKKTKRVAPSTRLTMSLRDDVGLGSYGAVVQSTTSGKQVYVERSVYFGTNWEGSTSEVATDTASTSWHFAEGSRRGEFFNNYFLLFNPQQVAASVQATFMTERGTSVRRTFNVGPQQRYTLDANNIADLAGVDFSATFVADQPVVAERAMYFAGTRGGPWTGGMAAFGANAPANRWLFAEGASGPGFDTYFTVLNPNSIPVSLTVHYLREGLGLLTKTYPSIPANSRYTLHMGTEIDDARGVSTEFLPTGGAVVVERSTYWGTNGWVEGATVMGVSSPACEWYVPEGSLVGGFDAYLLIGNPTQTFAQLNVSVYLENGERYTIPVAVGPFSRKTINMDHFFESASNTVDTSAQPLLSRSSFSTRVACTPGSAPVVVEHSLFLNNWRAGSSAFGKAR